MQADLQQQLSLVRGLQKDSQRYQQLLQLYEDLRTKAMLQDALYGTAAECCAPSHRRYAVAVAAAVGRWRHALVVKDVASANVRFSTSYSTELSRTARYALHPRCFCCSRSLIVGYVR